MVDWLRRKPSGDAVRADHGGFAAGRDIRDNKFGLDEEETGRRIAEAHHPLVARLAALADQVAREKGVATAPLLAVLAKLGEFGVAEHEIPARLEAKAHELIELRGQLVRLTNDRPELAVIREQALALLDHGDLDGARAALNRGRETARALREGTTRTEAEFLADEARIDHLQLGYRNAAQKYAEAAALVAPFNREAEWQHVLGQADELHDHGYEFGDNQALVEAIGIYRSALTLAPRPQRPLDWAMTQNRLGIALLRRGERESGPARLEEAITAYREALKEYSRERAPLNWAMTQVNLAAAVITLGLRESGTARLEEAIAAYREALKEYSRERVPLDWAKTQTGLGAALTALGLRESGTARLEEAIAAYREALKESTRERVPLDWAMTQSNLGAGLKELGKRESGTARLEEAVAAYREALKEYSRERVPLDWAKTQTGLGTVLSSLGWRESGTARLEEATAAYREALKESTRSRVPLDWAMNHHNLGAALLTLGLRENGTARLEEAVAAYRAALEEWTRDSMPLAWAASTSGQGLALRILAERRGDLSMAERALAQITAVFEMFRDARDAPNAAVYEAELPASRALVERLRKG